jgi:hypothetical protein
VKKNFAYICSTYSLLLIVAFTFQLPLVSFADTRTIVGGGGLSQTTADARYVLLSGATAMSGPLSLTETGAPALSAAGTAKLYPDSTAHTLKLSNNGAAYYDVLTSNTGVPKTGASGTFLTTTSSYTVRDTGGVFFIDGGASDIRIVSQTSTYLGAGGSLIARAATTGWLPASTDTVDLGGITSLWRTLYLSRGVQGSSVKSLTDGSPTIFAKVTIASGSTWTGAVIFKVEGTDGTDFTVTGGQINVSAINKAGTITCSPGTVINTAALTTGTKTQTLTGITCSDAGSGVLNLLANYTDNMTDSAGWPKFYHRVDSTDVPAYTPQ